MDQSHDDPRQRPQAPPPYDADPRTGAVPPWAGPAGAVCPPWAAAGQAPPPGWAPAPGYGPGPGYGAGYGPGYGPGYGAGAHHGPWHGYGHGHGHGWGPYAWAGYPPPHHPYWAAAHWNGAMPPAPGPAGGAPGAPGAGPAFHDALLSMAGVSLQNPVFLKGLLLGAGATLLLTNETVQRSLIGSVVKVWAAVQGGVEEMKERFRDAEAETAVGSTDSGGEAP